jgi:hypothetical protein
MTEWPGITKVRANCVKDLDSQGFGVLHVKNLSRFDNYLTLQVIRE